MAKKKPVREIEPKEISQEVFDEEPVRVIDEEDRPETNNQAGHSKTDLIREAVQAGYEKPAKGVEYIKNKHGVEIDSKYYSIVKGKLAKATSKDEASETETPEPKTAPDRPAAQTEPALATTSAIPAGLFDDLKQLRQMKDRYGDEFEKLVEAIG